MGKTGSKFAAVRDNNQDRFSLAMNVDATTADGVRHRLWVVTAPAVISTVARALAPKAVMIADGHHRYETMLALRDELRPTDRPPASRTGAVERLKMRDSGQTISTSSSPSQSGDW